ncbi:hypothetical protein ACLB2K_015387 [Fragaria x ananassa]
MAEAEVFVDDVVEMIILNLPLKSVLQFRCVSKKWDYGISDKRFSQKHYNIARCRKTVSRRLIITSSSSRMEFLDLQAKSSSFRKLTCPFLNLKKRQSHELVTLLGSSSGLEDCILAFDLENEEFGKLSLPKFDDDHHHLEYANHLGVSCEGRLHVVHCMKEFSDMNSASIWFMKEHGVSDSWTKLFHLKTSPEPLEPITCLGPIFVIEKDSDYYWNTFTEIRYQHQPQPRVDFLKHENLLDMIVCEETLVRLDDADEEEASSVGSGDESDDRSSDDGSVCSSGSSRSIYSV